MPSPATTQFRPTDGETPAPLPSIHPTNAPVNDAERDSDGVMHSPSIQWAPPKDDPSKPYRNLR